MIILTPKSFLMKVLPGVFVFILFLSSIMGLHAQPGNFGEPIIPSKQSKSILFGFDNFINDKPLQNQRNIAICSAFNGWLYATYSYFDNNLYQDALTILRSNDNGTSWSVLFDGSYGTFHIGISKMEILACGDDTADIKLFVGLGLFDTLDMYHSVNIIRFDKNGVAELEILNDNSVQVRDFALASDDLYPANNSNLSSVEQY